MVFGYNISKPDKFINFNSEKVTINEDVVQTVHGPVDSAWPMFQHDTKHTGLSPFGVTGNLGVLKWKFKMDGSVFSSPVIDKNGTIYIGGNYYFYAINPNGSKKWTYVFKYGWVESAAAIDENGTIYFGVAYGEPNYLYALYPNGTLKWKYRLGNHIMSSPVIGKDGTIFFGSYNKNIYALYPNGTLRWNFKTGGFVHTSPAIDDDGVIYCGSDDHYMYALYPNGTLKWKYNAGCRIGGDPTIGDDGTIYFGGVENPALYAIYPNGSRKWEVPLGSNVVSSPALAENDTLYIAAYKGPTGAYIYSINPNGTINWRYEVEDEAMSASPAIDKNGIIYIGGWQGNNEIGGNLYALNPNGTLRWFFHTGDSIHSSVAIGKYGTIYFGSWDEYLYAIKIIDNYSPEEPCIDGPSSGRPRTEYIYTAVASDPDGDNVSYFFDWGDDTTSGWTEFVPSGVSVNSSHSWLFRGSYVVRVRAKDDYGFIGDWGELEVKIPKIRQVSNNLYLRFLEKHPQLFPILRQLLRIQLDF
jgi:outer membrane protein assembly factor BamB